MNAPLHERIAAALDAAGDLTGEALLRHIESTYSADPDLIRECRALFAESEVVNPLLDGAASGEARRALEYMHGRLVAGTVFEPMGEPTIGTRESGTLPDHIGPYRILGVLGEGGMGVVYEAEQSSPRRRVAVKVIRSGFSGRAARARFRHESEVLAQLKHPGIAQVFEAGADEKSGEAYFAMEFVAGPTLSQFIEQTNPTVTERVALVALVCDAVQHAHQKGVIHRDLKPGNILVETGDSGVAQPKILDFGVAKLVAPDSVATSMTLDSGRIVGTLGYMSPEALEARPEAVDTRTDVYSLGVILYELLSGRLPIEVRGASITEAARRVRDDSPPVLGKLRPELRGDLQLISATALAKDRERRYSSAAEMAADLRRYLNHEPIGARPPSLLYSLGKFVRRRRAVAASIVVAVASLLGGFTFSTVQYLRAERALVAQAAQTHLAEQRLIAEQDATRRADSSSKLAQAVKDYFIRDMIYAASPSRLGADAKVIDVLDSAVAAVADRFSGEPELRAELQHEFSMIYNTLGNQPAALAQARQAAEQRRSLFGPTDRRTIDSEIQATIVLNTAGQHEESAPLIAELRERAAQVLPEHSAARLRLDATYGNNLQVLGKTAEAIAVLVKAADIAEKSLPATDLVRVSIRNNLATAYMSAQRTEEAVAELRKLVEEQRAALPPTDPAAVSTLNNFVVGLISTKQYEEAAARGRELVELVDRSHPAKHPARGYSEAALAAALHRLGRLEEARSHAERSFIAFTDVLDEASWEIERVVRRLMDIHSALGDAEGTLKWAVHAQRIRCFTSGVGEKDTLLKSFLECGTRLRKSEPKAAAVDVLQGLIASAATTVPQGHPRRSKLLANAARASIGLGLATNATEWLVQARADLATSADKDAAALIETVQAEVAAEQNK